MTSQFDYEEAFSRNIGWVTRDEQARLRTKRVAIAGLGGVGGSHLLALTRLGIGAFHVADFDSFDLANFNRQAGAATSTVGRAKADVLSALAKDINPELDIKSYGTGVTPENIEEFLTGVDVYVDGLDFFAFSAREMTFAACSRMGVPAVTAAPLGMGAAVLTFRPGTMTFEEYFQLQGHNDAEKALRFLLGLAPARLQMGYLVDPTSVDLPNKKGPSTIIACQLCAGLASAEALKLLLGRGKIHSAPHGLQYDAYQNKFRRTWRPGGNNHPLQRMALSVARPKFQKQWTMSVDTTPTSTIEKILDLARWAPSGDNTQPWRFEIVDDCHFVVHGFDTRDSVVYDVDGHASQIALGALLETLDIAASHHGLRASTVRRREFPDTIPTFDVRLSQGEVGKPNPLAVYIRTRSVQRRPLSPKPLSAAQKSALEASVAPLRVQWFEGAPMKLKVAALMFRNAKLRLTMPEAYEVHRSIIEWDAQYSVERVPDAAVGLDPLTAKLMKWVMGSWRRVRFMNRYLAGTWAPRIQLDLIPSLACGAHFVIFAESEPRTLDDFVAAGRAWQRFWLTATQQSLWLQPEITPIFFSIYVRRGKRFSKARGMWEQAERISENFEQLVGGKSAARKSIFMGRLGAGAAPSARSLRLPLEKLLVNALESHKNKPPT